MRKKCSYQRDEKNKCLYDTEGKVEVIRHCVRVQETYSDSLKDILLVIRDRLGVFFKENEIIYPESWSKMRGGFLNDEDFKRFLATPGDDISKRELATRLFSLICAFQYCLVTNKKKHVRSVTQAAHKCFDSASWKKYIAKDGAVVVAQMNGYGLPNKGAVERFQVFPVESPKPFESAPAALKRGKTSARRLKK